jgi:hypothetical protein
MIAGCDRKSLPKPKDGEAETSDLCARVPVEGII